jgi:calcineurin-like phosphoesterase family protein
MKYYYTSDWHLGHAKIIQYCNRPFKSVEEMDETIIRNHNARVKEDDVVYHVGDFCFRNSPGGAPGMGKQERAKEYIKRLNGNIIFIKGNHDSNNSVKTNIERLVVGYGNHRFNLVHNPEMADVTYQMNFVGHVHQHWKFNKKISGYGLTYLVNVGVDVNKFMPRTFEELYSELVRWEGYIH